MSLCVGSQYKSRLTGVIWEVLFIGTQRILLRVVAPSTEFPDYRPGTECAFDSATCERVLEPYKEPLKACKVRTVVALIVSQGTYQAVSITDQPSLGGGQNKFRDPNWPSTWRGSRDWKVVSDTISEIEVTS